MKILVTGATGFMGSYLTKALLNDNHDVAIVKRSFSSTTRVGDILHAVSSYDLDCTPIPDIITTYKPEVVVHLATNYGKATTSYSKVFEDNVIFPLQLMENLVPGTYFINTDTYFNNSNSHTYQYLNSYCLSKKYFLEMAQSYISSKAICLVNARLEHVYGPYDDPSKFTMNIIQQLFENRPSIDLTFGEQRRDFIYIDDVISAYQKIIKTLPGLGSSYLEYQIGTGKTYSIKHYVELSKKVSGSSSELLFGVLPYRNNEILSSQADNKLLEQLGWKPQVELQEGIKRIVSQLDRQRVVMNG